MTAEYVGLFEPGSPEWHAARADGIGGSEIAAVLGLSPFESRFSLWFRKTGVIDPVDETSEMEWGKRLEPVILGKFIDEHPEHSLTLTPAGTWRNVDRPWQIANPDLLNDRLLVEAKFSPFGDGWGPDGSDDIPVYYRDQVLWYMDCLDRRQAHLAVLIGGCEYREYVVDYDPVEAQLLRDAAVDFLDSIARGDRPNLDGHTATYQTVRELHADISAEDVDLDEATAAAFCHAKHTLAAAETGWNLARSTVADLMGDARRARFDGHTIATRQARGDGTPYVVAGRNLPDLTTTTTNPQGAAAA